MAGISDWDTLYEVDNEYNRHLGYVFYSNNMVIEMSFQAALWLIKTCMLLVYKHFT